MTENGEKAKISVQNNIDTRDHLMLTLVYINAFRASNIINITLKEVQSATKHEERDAYVFKNNKYKISLICGSKIIFAPILTHHHTQLYLKILKTSLSVR